VVLLIPCCFNLRKNGEGWSFIQNSKGSVDQCSSRVKGKGYLGAGSQDNKKNLGTRRNGGDDWQLPLVTVPGDLGNSVNPDSVRATTILWKTRPIGGPVGSWGSLRGGRKRTRALVGCTSMSIFCIRNF